MYIVFLLYPSVGPSAIFFLQKKSPKGKRY